MSIKLRNMMKIEGGKGEDNRREEGDHKQCPSFASFHFFFS